MIAAGLLERTIASIRELDKDSMAAARTRLDSLTKPKGSLGVLEEIAVRLAGIYRGQPASGPKTVVVMAGDHGIAGQGVSAYPQEVTCQMVQNFLKGGAAINVLSRAVDARVVVVDMGILQEPEPHEDLYIYRIKAGTGNIVVEPAMTLKEAALCIEAGIEVAHREISRGAKVLATGEMGIGNTSASAAVFSVLSGIQVEEVVGKGTGLSTEAQKHKARLIRQAILHNSPAADDGLEVLAKVGGLELGGMAGVILGAASRRVPVVVDGYVSGAAAMVAMQLAPQVRDYLFFSHLSAEAGHQKMLEWLGVKPLLHLDMRLGEGTGAVLAFPLIDVAVRIYFEMATFEGAGISGQIE
jgi:nicotinate-nucleotide--dimethylbenzimidazole phosphoribosyltransferase